MRILALETTDPVGSVAAMADGRVLAQSSLSAGQRSAQSLAPGILSLLQVVGWRSAEVQLVGVTIGPGSFTGLRVGVTAAKTFAYAIGAEILGIDTLEAIAAAAPAEVDRLAVAVDAQRGDVVAAVFTRDSEGWFCHESPARLVEARSWLNGLPSGIAIAGPVLARLSADVPAHARLLSPEFWSPRAEQVARLADRDFAAGRRDDVWKLLPRYSRRPAAEEKAG